jgi:DeoR family fructose operon transcriptional repressor
MSAAPGESYFVQERRRLILERLQAEGRVSVRKLSEELHVSEVTIRQDLRALEDHGLLDRTYGGAVRRETQTLLPELSFNTRLSKRKREKDALAAFAARFIEDGYSLALDASTSVYALVPYLKHFKKLTIVTNSLVIAQHLLDVPQFQVFLPGGRLRRDSISIVGRPEGLPDINLNLGFFGARGVSLANGFTDVDADEVSIKQALLARCVTSILLVDHSKWGQVAPYTFARPSQISRIITGADAPESLIAQFRAAGCAIEVVPTPML